MSPVQRPPDDPVSPLMVAKGFDLLARLKNGPPLTDEEVRLLRSNLTAAPGGSGGGLSSSPIGGSGSYAHSSFAGLGGPGLHVSSGPSAGLVIVVGLILLGLAAGVVYGAWHLARWLF